jgi:iron(III) transport system permease protein
MRHPLATAFALALAAFVLAPVVSLLHIALGGSTENWAHLATYVLPPALVNTLLLLAGVGVLTLVIGVGTAWTVTTFEFPGRSTLIWLLPLPLAIPTYIVAYIYVDLADTLGPLQPLLAAFGWTQAFNVRSLAGAILLMSFVLYPYVYLAARAMFQTQGAAAAEVARSAGATPWQVARGVTLPLARPAIVAGLVLALLEALNDIGANEYLGVPTLTLAIFTTWLNRGSLAGAAQIACAVVITVALLLTVERAARRGKSFVGIDQRWRTIARVHLQGHHAWLACVACLLPVVLGFIVPAGFLAREVIARGLLFGFDGSFARHALTTIIFAASATIAALVLGFGAAIALRVTRSRLVGGCVSVARLGYALPGTVLALGLLAPLVLIDEAINWLTRVVSGHGVGLLVIGSGAAVVIAYIVRFLAITIGFAQAGLARVSTDMDDAARIVGAPPRALVRLIHIPLSRPALWGAALLVFVDCLKELPATLLLRPLNVETLSTYIYQFASRGNFEEGALAALLIVAVGVVPVMRMARHADMASNLAQMPKT